MKQQQLLVGTRGNALVVRPGKSAEHYCEVVATFGAGADAYQGTWFDPSKAKQGEGGEARRLPPDGALAEAIRARCLGARGEIASLTGAEKSDPPPLLYDLTELQRHANRLQSSSFLHRSAAMSETRIRIGSRLR
jgi:DNA topoisomerase IA